MNSNNYTIETVKSQESKVLMKASIKKSLNKGVVAWLRSVGEFERAERIEHCSEHIGIADIKGVVKVVSADFCRERICNVCAWRRQSKFVAQMIPVLELLSKDYSFIFATLTVKNVRFEDLRDSIDVILAGYDKLLKRRQIKRAWVGKVRSLEITYNKNAKTFHPHLHLLIAVRKDYFMNADEYISTTMLSEFWKDCISAEYLPICDIRRVDEQTAAAVETLKYSFKFTNDPLALSAFFYHLKGRRLVSFSGVFAEMRKLLRQTDFEKILIDDIGEIGQSKFKYTLYKFDATGGVYTYYKEMEWVKNE